METFFIILGGGIGACFRYLISLWSNMKFGFTYQTTFFINFLGSLFLGIMTSIGSLNQSFSTSNYYSFLTLGLAGGFTTFSTFSYENYLLICEKKFLTSFLYCILSVVFSVIGFFWGYFSLNLL